MVRGGSGNALGSVGGATASVAAAAAERVVAAGGDGAIDRAEGVAPQERGEDVEEVPERRRHGDVRAAGEAELGRAEGVQERGEGGLRDEGRRARGADVRAEATRGGGGGAAGGRVALGEARGGARGEDEGARSHRGGRVVVAIAVRASAAARARAQVEAGEVLRGEAGLGAIRAHALDARLAARDGGERRGDAHDLPAALERRPVDRHGGGHRRGRARAEEPRRDLSARDGGEKSLPRTRQFIRLVCHQRVNSAPAAGPGPSSFLHLLPPNHTPARASSRRR